MTGLAVLMASAALLAGCETVRSVTGSSSSPAPAPAATPAPAPAPAAPGDTVHVKGVGDWEGDITGKPAAGSRFKGQGRLIFAGGSAGDWSNGHLIWIIHNAAE